jgi:hypothetical protein
MAGQDEARRQALGPDAVREHGMDRLAERLEPGGVQPEAA